VVNTTVLRATNWINRFAVAFGGFLIFAGIIVMGVFLLEFLGMIDFSLFEIKSLQNLPLLLLLAIGLADLIAGIILWRS
jgi:hypothetical protein